MKKYNTPGYDESDDENDDDEKEVSKKVIRYSEIRSPSEK